MATLSLDGSPLSLQDWLTQNYSSWESGTPSLPYWAYNAETGAINPNAIIGGAEYGNTLGGEYNQYLSNYQAPSVDIGSYGFEYFQPLQSSYGAFPSAGTSDLTNYLNQTYGDKLLNYLQSTISPQTYYNPSSQYLQGADWTTSYLDPAMAGSANVFGDSATRTLKFDPSVLQNVFDPNDPYAKAYSDWFSGANTQLLQRAEEIQSQETSDFYKNFALSAVGALAGPLIGPSLTGALSPVIGETLAPIASSALIGGTTSELGGGDFFQGALKSGLTSGISSGINTGLESLGTVPGGTTMFEGMGDYDFGGTWGSGDFGQYSSITPVGGTGYEFPSLNTADYGITPTSGGTIDWGKLLTTGGSLLSNLFGGGGGTNVTSPTGTTTGGTTTGGTTGTTGSLSGLISSIYGYNTADEYTDWMRNLMQQQQDPYAAYRPQAADWLNTLMNDPLQNPYISALRTQGMNELTARDAAAGQLFNSPERQNQLIAQLAQAMPGLAGVGLAASGAGTSPAEYGGVQANMAKSLWPVELAKASAVGGSLSQLPGAITGTTQSITDILNYINQLGGGAQGIK